MLALEPTRFADMVDSHLVRRFGMVQESGVATVAGTTVHRYRFTHALLHDHLHANMTPLQRAHIHRMTAESMLDLFGDGPHDGEARIASQFDRAGDRPRAARAYQQAGLHVLMQREYDRATSSFGRVLEMDVQATDPATHVHGYIGLGNSARGLGQVAEARSHLARACELAAQCGLPVVEGHALESLAMLDFDAGNMDTGAVRLATVVKRYLDSGAAEFNMGLIAEEVHDLKIPRSHYTESLAIRESIGQVALQIDSIAGLMRAAVQDGVLDDVRSLFEELENTVSQRGIIGVEHAGRLFLALISASRALGDEPGAMDWHGRALAYIDERARRITDDRLRAVYLNGPIANRRIAQLVDRDGTGRNHPWKQHDTR